MQSLMYPSIDLDSTFEVLDADTWRRGMAYAREGRVLRCLWDPDAEKLFGTVRGNKGRTYLTTAELMPVDTDTYAFDGGDCSCPMEEDCKHVAAVVIAAAGPTVLRPAHAPAPQAPPAWRRSLDALLPPVPTNDHTKTPLAVELTLSMNGSSPMLDARLVRPGKRGGWVAGDLNWARLPALRHNYPDAQVRVLQELYSTYRASSSTSAGYYSYSYGGYGYDDGKTISLRRFGSPQLWSLLDEARRVGVRLLQARPLREVPPHAEGQLCLDVTANDAGDLRVAPALRVDGATARPLAFIGSSGHGAVYDDGGLRLARLDKPAPEALQRMALGDQPLVIPAGEAPRFAADYYPRLRRIAAITSSDESFTPPTIVGPTLVLHADYQDDHRLELTWEWAYRLADNDIRVPVDAHRLDDYRDLPAESALALSIDAPLEQVGLRSADGTLTATSLSGLDTLRFATEIQPLLGELPDVTLEVLGNPVDYREAGGSLVIAVTTDAVPDETDWFDLGVTISIEGNQVPFVSVFTAIASGQSHLLLPDGAYFALDKPELVKLRRLIEEARALTDAEDGPPRISRFQVGLFDELAELGVVTRQAEEWRRQVDGLRALRGLEPAPVPVPRTLGAELRPYQADGFSWLSTLYTHGLGGILADDMGLGKTIQTLALICHARQQNPGMAPFLVVAPASVVANWAAEAARFAPELSVVALYDTLRRAGADLDELAAGADIVVTSYTLFRLDFDSHADRTWSGLILDEAQYVKNHHSKTYQCARKLATPFKLAITGTPMENNLMELWSLLSITAPGLFPSPAKFADFYAKPIEKSGDAELLALFRRRIKPLVKRRTKELVAAELPPKQEQVLDIELPPRHRALYNKRLTRERQKVLGLLDDMQRNRFTILKSLTVLRQMALHPGLVDPAHDALACAKIDALAEHLRDVVDGGHRALVFSQFTRFLGRVRERLTAEGIDYCYLDGRTRNRAAAIQRFKEGSAPVFLISLKAGGFGLNLTEADYCFLLDPWWNPATEAQAVDRTHRIGQTRNVMVYRLIARDTIEDKVVALNARKAKLFTSVIDDGNAFGSAVTADDIRGLLT